MRLLIFRHAKAEKGAPGMRDRDRPLNPRGVKDASRMGGYLAHHTLQPDFALVSPARRTRETWDALAAAFSTAVPERYEDRLDDATPQTISAVLREADASVRR